MVDLSREALIDRIIRELEARTGRAYAASDFELIRRPGERPNWNVTVRDMGSTDVTELRTVLSELDWKEEDD